MKYIVFGGFDYAIPYEMDQNAIFEGIDYFVDNNPELIGKKYLGKEIKHPSTLLKEEKDDIFILIGSVIFKTEIAFQLKDMGFEEEKNFIWAIAFTGDKKCARLWRHIEWSDRKENATNLLMSENGEYSLSRLKVATKMVEWNKYETLIDLGAANERVKEFLPRNINYIPVDYVKYSENTVLCDINKYEFPNTGFIPNKTCIFSIGNIQYCKNWKWYLETISKNCECLILAHDDLPRLNREYRKTHWSRYNALFDHEFIRYMQSLGFIITDSVDFRLKSTCYKFERGAGQCKL